MTARWLGLGPTAVDGDILREAFADIRRELAVPGPFPSDVYQEVEQVAVNGSGVSDGLPRRDATSLPLVTLDPPGSMDLDQALHIEPSGAGFRVRYAIADVPSFVMPGSRLDAESRRRGETLYLPDGSIPLHPKVLSEDAASLLPGRDRPAFLWDLSLDSSGEVTQTRLERAVVRSRARLDYPSVQRSLESGTAEEPVKLLHAVGELRAERERARGGANLPLPEQEIVCEDGHYLLRFRPLVPIEECNAQVSLMAGMAAAQIMVDGAVGILRTMPPPDPRVLERYRLQAIALGSPWPLDEGLGSFLRRLDRGRGAHVALMHQAGALFRGAGYTPFDGQVPQRAEHSALATRYAHTTAPLRRLVDRFVLVICLALHSGQEVPEWARVALPALPEIMSNSGRLAASLDRACTDAVEAAVLSGMTGAELDAMVVESRGEKGVKVQVSEPAVLGSCNGTAPLGAAVRVRVASADVAARKVRFELAGSLPVDAGPDSDGHT